MTFPPTFPTDPSDLYALMGAEALFAHLEAAAAQLARLGVEITPAARLGLDEIAEAVVEHHAQHDPAALGRAIAKAQRDLNGALS